MASGSSSTIAATPKYDGFFVSAEIIEDPISFDPMENAVVTPCGHSFSEHSIREWLETKDSCPECRAFLVLSQVVPNITLRRIIESSPPGFLPDPPPRPVRVPKNTDPSYSTLHPSVLRAILGVDDMINIIKFFTNKENLKKGTAMVARLTVISLVLFVLFYFGPLQIIKSTLQTVDQAVDYCAPVISSYTIWTLSTIWSVISWIAITVWSSASWIFGIVSAVFSWITSCFSSIFSWTLSLVGLDSNSAVIGALDLFSLVFGSFWSIVSWVLSSAWFVISSAFGAVWYCLTTAASFGFWVVEPGLDMIPSNAINYGVVFVALLIGIPIVVFSIALCSAFIDSIGA